MSLPVSVLRSIVFSAILLCILVSTIGADTQESGNLHIAVIDRARLVAEYKVARTYRETLDKMRVDANIILQTLDRYHMLTAIEQDKLTRLILKQKNLNNLTRAEKQQMQDLKARHKQRSRQFWRISSNASKAKGAQRLLLAQLEKFRHDTLDRIKTKDEAYQREIKAKEVEFNARIDQDIRDCISTVTREKKLNQVFSSEALLYAGIDITEDVLKRLNK